MSFALQPTEPLSRPSPVEKVRRLIKRKTSEKARLLEEIGEFEASLAPLAEMQQQVASLDGETHALFQQLLDKPNFGRRARRQITELYEELQDSGLISPDPSRLDEADPCQCPVCTARREAEAAFDFDFDFDPNLGFERPADEPQVSEQEPAPKPKRDAEVHALYRKLALRFHPDRAEDEARRAKHESVMQQVNDAYHGGDTSRLLELSRELGIDVEGLKTSDGVLTELVEQYEAIKGEVRALRHSVPGVVVVETRRAKRAGAPLPLEVMRHECEAEVARVAEIRDFVRAFRDGKMSLRAFMKGPPGSSLGDLDMDEEALMAAFLEMAEELEAVMGAPSRSTPGSRRKGGARGKKTRRR